MRVVKDLVAANVGDDGMKIHTPKAQNTVIGTTIEWMMTILVTSFVHANGKRQQAVIVFGAQLLVPAIFSGTQLYNPS